MKVWTVTLEGAAQPFLWLTHEGVESEQTIQRAVANATGEGLTVIVGLITKRRRITVEEIPHG